MRVLGAVLVAVAVALLVAVLVYVLAVLPGQRAPLTVATPDPDRAPSSSPTASATLTPVPTPTHTAMPVSFSQLVIGTCLTDAHLVTGEGTAVDSLESIDCAAPHHEEVLHLGVYADGAYPGADALIDQLDQVCVGSFAEYVGIGYGSSSLSLDYLFPTETSWIAGDRGYACLVYGPEPLVGSVAGSAR